MRFPMLRHRLLVVTVLTLILGLGGLLLVSNLLLAAAITSGNDQRLHARLDAQAAALSIHAGHLRASGSLGDGSLDAYGWIVIGHRLAEHPIGSRAALDRAAVSLATDPRAAVAPITVGQYLLGRRILLAHAGASRAITVVAAVDVAQLAALQREILLASLAAGLVIVVGAGVAVHRALAAALAPVAQMTRDAEDWSAHDLERRFALPGRGDEISHLATTLDQLLGRIAASRRHEQRFAAEVAHELRTPLAVIRGVAELAGDGHPAEMREGLGRIVEHSDRIAATLATLIAFARRETPPARDGVDLEAILAEFEVPVSHSGPPIPPVEGDPGLIRQIFAPLLDNAQRHAASRVWLEIAASGDRVLTRIRDDGPGVDPRLGVKVLLPGVRGDDGDGAGLGLPLAQRLAHSCGGEVRLGEGAGGCFVVVLPSTPLPTGAPDDGPYHAVA